MLVGVEEVTPMTLTDDLQNIQDAGPAVIAFEIAEIDEIGELDDIGQSARRPLMNVGPAAPVRGDRRRHARAHGAHEQALQQRDRSRR